MEQRCEIIPDQISGGDTTLQIVGFAVPEAANKAIAAEWNKTDAGRGVKFKGSYGASGDQSRAVVGGLKADYVHFSLTSDVTRLVDEGLVAEDWNRGPNKGVVSSSIVVLAVREGNPIGRGGAGAAHPQGGGGTGPATRRGGPPVARVLQTPGSVDG